MDYNLGTMLMNIRSLQWDSEPLSVRMATRYLECLINDVFFFNRFFSIPEHILPEIKSSATIFGQITKGVLKGIPIGAVRKTDNLLIESVCVLECV